MRPVALDTERAKKIGAKLLQVDEAQVGIRPHAELLGFLRRAAHRRVGHANAALGEIGSVSCLTIIGAQAPQCERAPHPRNHQ